MSFLTPLLEIQDLDLASDAARERSAALPEREALPALERELAEIDAAVAAAEAERTASAADEERLGLEVGQVARDIEDAEVERYAGKRIDRDEAVAHDASQAALREKQEGLEEQEMELLEKIDAIEQRLAEQESARAANRLEAEKNSVSIEKVESEVAAELERLSAARFGLEQRIPEAIYAVYDRIREQPRSGGRGAASLVDRRCGTCRIKLPSLEHSRMQAEPEDALIQCPQCRRVLVRG
ncbi:MAG: hypothetical protein CL908_11240 [Deltaproteobacteria bacterium]|nr:hypothetical protein [Deltaproteobacteria bacterium]